MLVSPITVGSASATALSIKTISANLAFACVLL